MLAIWQAGLHNHVLLLLDMVLSMPIWAVARALRLIIAAAFRQAAVVRGRFMVCRAGVLLWLAMCIRIEQCMKRMGGHIWGTCLVMSGIYYVQWRVCMCVQHGTTGQAVHCHLT
jgi:hypothetical protein